MFGSIPYIYLLFFFRNFLASKKIWSKKFLCDRFWYEFSIRQPPIKKALKQNLDVHDIFYLFNGTNVETFRKRFTKK